MAGIIGFAVKGLGGAIGLGAESYHAHKEKKHSSKAASLDEAEERTGAADEGSARADESVPTDHSEHADDALWALDDAQEHLVEESEGKASEDEKEKKTINPDEIIRRFLHRHPFQREDPSAPLPKLPLTVILPQRRPQNRTRGFIRAYAPVLEEVDIDQASFLDFLETFNSATLANPWINAINLASFATMMLPTGISMAISIAIQISTQIAIEMQGRSRTNKFLYRINEEYFRPRGFYCLVLTWKPENTDVAHEEIDMSSTILHHQHSAESTGIDKMKYKFSTSAATTHGEMEFPVDIAPLIYPALDAVDDLPHDEKAHGIKSKMKNSSKFVGDYYDKRAQSAYAGQNPDSHLAQAAGPKPEWHSRFSDPNHPANSGSLWSLVTGGHYNPPSLGDRRTAMYNARMSGGLGAGLGGRLGGGLGGGLGGRLGGGLGGGLGGRLGASSSDAYAERSQALNQRAGMRGNVGFGGAISSRYGGSAGYGNRGGGTNLGGLPALGGPMMLRKMLQQDVLYLMIVNMPSEEELQHAEQFIEARKHS